MPGVSEGHAACRFASPCADSSCSPARSRRIMPVEDGAQPHDRRALLDGHRVVLGRAHRELRARPCAAGQLAQRREVAAGWPPGPRRTAASSSARRRGTGQRSTKRVELAGRDPALALLAGDVDLDQHLACRRARGARAARSTESLATEWISARTAATCLTLRLWRWPMKSQREAAAGSARALASRSCARFSPTSVMPASASTPHLLERRRT